MKNSGLKNRFNRDRLQAAWRFSYKCLWCGKSRFDAFHHIISPSSQAYQAGNFNSSILNACPIHNHGCHLYNPELHKAETEKMLLEKVLEILIKTDIKFNEKDKEFFRTYKELYSY